MKLSELNADQLEVLKQHYLMLKNKNVSYDDLYNADDLVSYSDLEDLYGATEFVQEDFESTLEDY